MAKKPQQPDDNPSETFDGSRDEVFQPPPAEPPQAQTGGNATPRQERTTTRGLSGELVAMGKIDRVMQELNEAAQAMVCGWFYTKYLHDRIELPGT